MKKLFTIVCLLACALLAQAQDYAVLHVGQDPSDEYHYCATEFGGVTIYAPNCGGYGWTIYYGDGTYEHIYNQSPISFDNTHYWVRVIYEGCGLGWYYDVFFHAPIDQPVFSNHIEWMRQGESLTLSVDQDVFYDYECRWSNGDVGFSTEVTQGGVYGVTLTSLYGCDTITDYKEVCENVELYRATVDLETNLNKVTWQVTPEQAEYISEVKAYRDGLLVGAAPYEQGYYLDAIGSDNAARNYQIVGVTIEGEDCPLASFQKGTIHTTYYQDVNGNLNMTWNIPYVEEGAQGALTYFQICKYDPATEELTVVDQVNAAITDYTCGVNQFDGGQAVIAAVFSNSKGLEDLSFSNLTTDILGVGENDGNPFRIYPNPAQGRFTVEGTGTMRIANVLGQEIMVKDIEGMETVELPQGVYFVQLNGTVRKIVVE